MATGRRSIGAPSSGPSGSNIHVEDFGTNHSLNLTPVNTHVQGDEEDMEMESTDDTRACITTFDHEPDGIKSHLTHYLGCIEICQRSGFLNKDHKAWFAVDPEEREAIIGNNAIAIAGWYRRTDIVRAALSAESTPPIPLPDVFDQPQHRLPEWLNDVKQVEASHQAWLDSDRYKRGIKKVQEWRSKPRGNPPTAKPVSEDAANSRIRVKEPERAIAAHLANQRREKIAKDHPHIDMKMDPNQSVAVPAYELEKDVNAYVMHYKISGQDATNDSHPGLEGEELADPRLKGSFPGQRLALKYLLAEENSDLVKGRDGEIRYIHIPANNMHWVKQTIERYYHGDGFKKSEMIFRPQFWSGQQHGGGTKILHARHLRPICENISSDLQKVEAVPRNLVLFMPYLHWETDRKRETIARVIDVASEKHRKQIEEQNAKEASARRHTWKGLERDKFETKARRRLRDRLKERTEDLLPTKSKVSSANSNANPQVLGPSGHLKHFPMRTASDVGGNVYLGRAMCNRSGARFDVYGRLVVPNKLGQFLLDAARLYESVSTFRDRKMIEQYLYHPKAPLHPRRTLDQSYYWTLKTTKARDRDQVVYRGTDIDPKFTHLYREIDQQKRRRDRLHKLKFWSPTPDPPCERHWKEHGHLKEDEVCEQCREDIRKVSQVVMVDQLWMWILDEKTIITCFPKRYGLNKGDESGVHRSIRMRLQQARQNQIRSVFDLALIILDECSNTFFDRTKTNEKQPQVTDIFAEAIGRVTNKQTISFEHVWHWTKMASKIYRSPSKFINSDNLHVPLLDINPEGELQREIKDIIDELNIMLYIKKKQKDVVARFVKQVENIIEPDDGLHNTGVFPASERHLDVQLKQRQLEWFHISALELTSKVDGRIAELEDLKAGAESTAQSVKDLLDLKAQQASVVQAWQSVKQADEAVKQGKAIIMFTIVTIVFLPLSFMSSVFGMNNSDFQGDNWSLSEQLRLMFPISVSIILVTVVLAFSNYLRSLIWCAWTLAVNWLLTQSYLYYVYLIVKDKCSGERIKRAAENRVLRMRKAVARTRLEHVTKAAETRRDREAEGEAEEGEVEGGTRPPSGGGGDGGGDAPLMNGTRGPLEVETNSSSGEGAQSRQEEAYAKAGDDMV